jgi:hypothetical protein
MEDGTNHEGRTDPRLEAALAHRLRARMFAELSVRALDPSALAALLGITTWAARYHYRVLERLGGISAARKTRAG